MTDSTDTNHETLTAKEQYSIVIEKSDHLPAAKVVGEFVLDALINSSGESQKIRELREEIKSAISEADDDKAHSLMVELKTIKDAEQENANALAEISKKFSISQILASYSKDPAFEEIAYGLALQVLSKTQQALTSPSGKSKPAREKTPPKPALVYVISKGDESAELVMRIGKGAANLAQDAEAFTLLGFAVEKDTDGKDTLVPATYTDKMGVEHQASRRTIATAIEEKTAFEGYTIVTKE
ncbi:hypothetical protein ALQ37_200183 [Pseudomonas syringae pv. aptata]|uniref:Uncharacterized protein n=1 Tax=Pseudomonas syringae pv. aptata TaxID=83167 RepID=A0A0Q0BRV6_PSEAP|nr:hypothetical protein [Pseudomonas syringae]KPY98002.1 Uncharacterized protein ALO85_04155 [Pseudomonas syringae pv. aptata]RMO65439.1 hypothetical protein ALQ37_200183 [Pseudomonas syringae pv. aptata]